MEESERTYRGRVKFFVADKGWGGIESDEVPGDVWVYYTMIKGRGSDRPNLGRG